MAIGFFVIAESTAYTPVECGPFSDRKTAEMVAIEYAKRSDVQPNIAIVARQVGDGKKNAD